MSPAPRFGSGMLSVKKALIMGFILSLFSPLAGMIYSLGFIFNKNTWREGVAILIWCLVVTLLMFVGSQWLLSHGQTLPAPVNFKSL
jgi:hypothetical protein